MRRVAFALGLVMILPACGLSVAGVAGGESPVTPVSTVAPDPVSTTAPAPASAKPAMMEVAPYFLIDESGHNKRSGPFLVPVAREVPSTTAVARAAIEQLLAGPTQAEQAAVPALSSAIPAGVGLLGLTIDSGTATIDLSSGFALGEDAAAVAMRVAQVVFTLTRFDSVERVRFLEQGREVATPTSGGDLVKRAVSRGDYLDFAAAISVESPVYGGETVSPLRVTGFAAVFEATFKYALTDGKGLVIEEGFASTSNGTGWGAFDFTVDYNVDQEQPSALIVWVHSAEDGSPIDIREYPIWLAP